MIIQMAGIRNKQDALMCVDAGFNVVGLLVGQKHKSDDFISKELAKEIKDCLPKAIRTTLITHLEKADEIVDLVKYIDVDFIQLHSYIDEGEVAKIHNALPNKKFFRLIHIDSDGKILSDIKNIKYVDYYFTDSINLKTNQYGGTGILHNFTTDKRLALSLNKPVIIAGGLTPINVAEIIEECRPYGVDVNSGCRGANGFRDKAKTYKFALEAKMAFEQINMSKFKD